MGSDTVSVQRCNLFSFGTPHTPDQVHKKTPPLSPFLNKERGGFSPGEVKLSLYCTKGENCYISEQQDG